MTLDEKIRMPPRVTLYVQRKINDATSATDDIIRIFEDDDYHEMYRVVYSAPDMKRKSTFYMTKTRVLTYVSDILKSLRYDAVPFEAVQVTPAIFPSVVYHVAELDDSNVRHLILDVVDTSLRSVEVA